MRLRANKISFRLPGIEKRFFIYRGELILFIVLLAFTVASLSIVFKKGLVSPTLGFFPLLFLVHLLTIAFRPKPKYPVTRTTEQWDAITKGNGPFIYTLGGFVVEIENNKRIEMKWAELEEVTVFRREFLAGDEIGLAVKGNNESFSITENTAGWIMFMNKMKENLTLNVPEWFGEIQTSKENIVVYKK